MDGPYQLAGEWLLLPQLHSIQHRESQQRRFLGAQNFALLQYLLAHPNQVIAREQLLSDVWQGIAVNDNTLSKAVAELRKALGDDSKQARYIVTLPKRGYQFIADVATLESIATTTPPAPTQSWHRRWWLAPLLLLPLLALWWWPASTPAGSLRLQPFTSDGGVEMSPSFSFDGQWLAYVAYPVASQQAQLHIQALDGGHAVAVAKVAGEIESPAWSTQQWYLAYLQRQGEQCDVIVARFNRDTAQLNDARVMGPCAPTARVGFAVLQWSADGQSLFYHRLNAAGQRELVRHDWQQNKISAVPLDVPYAFAVHPYRDEIAFASVDVMSSTLQLGSFAGEGKKSIYSRAELFLGLGWDSQHDAVLISSGLAGGRLERVSKNGHVDTLFTSNSPLMQPTMSVANNVIAATQVVVKHDLWRASLHKNESGQPLIASTHFDYSPQFSHSGQQLVFISNRNGKPEIWHALQDGSEQQRLLNLPDEQWPVNLQWSPDDRYIAIGSSAKIIWRFDRVTNNLEMLSPATMACKNPRWSLDGKRLYYAELHNTEGRIAYYDTETRQHIKTNIEADLYAPAADGHYAYLLRYGHSEVRGVWQYDETTQQQQRLLPPLDRFNWQNFSVSKTGFYFLAQEQGQWRVNHWQANGATVAFDLRIDNAGPLFVDFTVSPDEKNIVYTHIADLQTDIILLR